MSISGKRSQGRYGAGPSTIGTLHGWTVEEAADDLERTDAEDAGYGDTDIGCKQCTITLNLYYDSTGSPYTPFAAGTVISNLKLYIDGIVTGNGNWLFPSSVVTRVGNPTEVRGRIELTITLKSKGTYTAPVYTGPS